MTLPAFAALVSQMRAAQRDYFRHRDSEALTNSKRLEREVDRAIAEILEPEPMPPFAEKIPCS